MEYRVSKTIEFTEWFESLPNKERAQVADGLSRIQNYGHFGTAKYLDDGLWELKFSNGTRIYFARTAEKEITLILGGNKNGQQKDIKKAKKFINR